jgi:hypothetical protein
MFMQGTTVIKFDYLLKINIPVEWTIDADSQAELMARSQGKRASDMETHVFLVAPECASSRAYQAWLTGLDHPLALQAVPICIVCASTFDRDYGHLATERFEVSMRVRGRPHHFSRMQFEKHECNRR